MVIRLVSVSDQMDLPDFNDIFCAVLGWRGDMGYVIRVHSQEFNSFRRKTRASSICFGMGTLRMRSNGWPACPSI